MDPLLKILKSSLEAHPHVCDIDMTKQPVVSESDVSSWEYKHCVFMPSDLKAFYLTQNGILLNWSIKAGTGVFRVGRIAINALSKLTYEELDPITKQNLPFEVATKIIKLDSIPSVGSICLLYQAKTEKVQEFEEVPWKEPSIWILRRNGYIQYLTDTFTSYFRLMVAYGGLEEWVNKLLGLALSPSAKQWYYIMGRLNLIEE